MQPTQLVKAQQHYDMLLTAELKPVFLHLDVDKLGKGISLSKNQELDLRDTKKLFSGSQESHFESPSARARLLDRVYTILNFRTRLLFQMVSSEPSGIADPSQLDSYRQAFRSGFLDQLLAESERILCFESPSSGPEKEENLASKSIALCGLAQGVRLFHQKTDPYTLELFYQTETVSKHRVDALEQMVREAEKMFRRISDHQKRARIESLWKACRTDGWDDSLYCKAVEKITSTETSVIAESRRLVRTGRWNDGARHILALDLNHFAVRARALLAYGFEVFANPKNRT
jgi:uncharacterized membrane protein